MARTGPRVAQHVIRHRPDRLATSRHGLARVVLGAPYFGAGAPAPAGAAQQIEFLKRQAAHFAGVLDEINKRLDELQT